MGAFSERLREQRDHTGLSQEQFAALAGQSKKSQGRYETGERSPDVDYLLALSEHGVDIAYLLTGQRSATGNQEAIEAQRLQQVLSGGGEAQLTMRAALADYGSPRDDAEALYDYSPIQLHNAYLAAGAGMTNGPAEILAQVAFPNAFLQSLGADPDYARLVRAHGDSMEPSIYDNDVLMIDTRRKHVPVKRRAAKDRRRGAIYAILDDGEARVKRVERPGEDCLALISDNLEYPPELFYGDELKSIEIVGKVVWWGHVAKE